MPTLEKNLVLSPHRFTSMIRERDEFHARPDEDDNKSEVKVGNESKDKSEVEALTPHEQLQRAIARSALSIASEREQTHGEYDLDANLFRLVGNLDSLYENVKTADSLKDQYHSYKNMPKEVRGEFNTAKAQVIDFNDTLREVINAGASKFDFNELLGFMTTMYAKGSGQKELSGFQEYAKSHLNGMRDEMAFEQMLITAGIDYERGVDYLGEDFIIDGIAFDVKSSPIKARHAQREAIRQGRDPRRIIWSHIDFDDYKGKLTLPYEASERIFAKLKPDLERIVPGFADRKRA